MEVAKEAFSFSAWWDFLCLGEWVSVSSGAFRYCTGTSRLNRGRVQNTTKVNVVKRNITNHPQHVSV